MSCAYSVGDKICGKPSIGVCPACHKNVCKDHSHTVAAELYCIDHGPQTKVEGI